MIAAFTFLALALILESHDMSKEMRQLLAFFCYIAMTVCVVWWMLDGLFNFVLDLKAMAQARSK